MYFLSRKEKWQVLESKNLDLTKFVSQMPNIQQALKMVGVCNQAS